jgi:hypothetical protein
MVAACQWCCFTSGSLHPIVWSVADKRFSSRVVGRSLYYDIVNRLSPLLGQSNKGRAFRYHALNWLHNSTEPNDVEVRIRILNHSIIRHLGIGHFWSPDGGIATGTVVWRCSGRGHHDDKVTLIGRAPIGTFPDHRVIISWILIREHCRCRGARCSGRWLEDRCLDRDSLSCLGSVVVWPYIRI